MLINYEASDNEEPSFSETLEKMNSDIDIYSTSCAKNKNVFNLSPNPLSEVNSLSMGIPFEANIGPMQLQKAQIFQEKNKTCVWKENKTCDQIEVCEEFEARKKKIMNEKKKQKTMVKQFFNINLKIVDEKASDWQNCAICIESVANTIVKIIKCNQCSHMIH